MPDNNPSQLVDQGPRDDNGQPLPPAVDGVVARAPASDTDLLHVSIAGFDDHSNMFGPCPWGPTRGTTLPSVGDRCLVVFSDLETPWVVCWWPQGASF